MPFLSRSLTLLYKREFSLNVDSTKKQFLSAQRKHISLGFIVTCCIHNRIAFFCRGGKPKPSARQESCKQGYRHKSAGLGLRHKSNTDRVRRKYIETFKKGKFPKNFTRHFICLFRNKYIYK